MKLTIEDIKNMLKAVDEGEQLEYYDVAQLEWYSYPNPTVVNNFNAFESAFKWRIKPTIEVNGKLCTKAEALHLWNTSVAKKQGKGYLYNTVGAYQAGEREEPLLEAGSGTSYRWQQEGVEMHCVNDVPIVEVCNQVGAYYVLSGGKQLYCNSPLDALKLSDAIRATITKQTI